MLLAVFMQAAESAGSSDPFHGYPPWLVVLVGAVIVAAALWIFAKLLKWVIWLVIALVLVGGLVVSVRMYLEETPTAVQNVK